MNKTLLDMCRRALVFSATAFVVFGCSQDIAVSNSREVQSTSAKATVSNQSVPTEIPQATPIKPMVSGQFFQLTNCGLSGDNPPVPLVPTVTTDNAMTPCPTVTLTPTLTPTATPTVTPTLTPTITPTQTPTITPTPVPTATLTPIPTPTSSPTITPVPVYPDLVIVEVSSQPEHPSIGDRVKWFITIRNDGKSTLSRDTHATIARRGLVQAVGAREQSLSRRSDLPNVCAGRRTKN